MPALCSKLVYYADIMLDALAFLLFLKLCCIIGLGLLARHSGSCVLGSKFNTTRNAIVRNGFWQTTSLALFHWMAKVWFATLYCCG